jgi:hypothetical protein
MYRTPEELRAELTSGPMAVPLSQGDILDQCPLVFWADQTREVPEDAKPHSVPARVIILTQACDLANEKTVRATVAVVHDAAHLVQTGRVKEKFIRDNVPFVGDEGVEQSVLLVAGLASRDGRVVDVGEERGGRGGVHAWTSVGWIGHGRSPGRLIADPGVTEVPLPR